MSTRVPELETERLRMVAWAPRHHDAYAEMCANPRTQRFLGGVFGRDDTWRRMAMFLGHWQLNGFGNWVLELKSDGAFVGYAGLWQPSGWPEPEIMWGLVERHEGRGLATEAAERARSFAFGVLGWATAVSYINAQNEPSRRLAERLGAIREPERRSPGGNEVWRHRPAGGRST